MVVEGSSHGLLQGSGLAFALRDEETQDKTNKSGWSVSQPRLEIGISQAQIKHNHLS
jgi:hypothetical protein